MSDEYSVHDLSISIHVDTEEREVVITLWIDDNQGGQVVSTDSVSFNQIFTAILGE